MSGPDEWRWDIAGLDSVRHGREVRADRLLDGLVRIGDGGEVGLGLDDEVVGPEPGGGDDVGEVGQFQGDPEVVGPGAVRGVGGGQVGRGVGHTVQCPSARSAPFARLSARRRNATSRSPTACPVATRDT